jgi:hypothetical protein
MSESNKVYKIDTEKENIDPFSDPSKLRLSQNFADEIGVKRHIAIIPVRRPNPQTFIRVHRDDEFHQIFGILELKDSRESYLVLPEICSYIADEIINRILYYTITRKGDVFLWPVKTSGDTRDLDPWNSAAHELALLAREKWIRVKPNRDQGMYEARIPEHQFDDPEWPILTYEEILRKAFKDKLIDSMEHPVLKKLRGEL